MKNMKVTILGSLILVMAFVIIGISVSFAYYTNAIREEGDRAVSIQSGGLTMNFETAADKYITATSSSLISEADILNSDNYTEFSIDFPSENNANKASYNLFLTNIKLTSNYKSSDVKWALYDASNTRVNYGDFSSVTLGASETSGDYTLYNVDNIPILNETEITKGTTVSYKLYVWLNSNPTKGQNNLLNGKITARVGFRGVSK